MTKIISLSDDAYSDLKDLKRPGESFSEVVIRITERGNKKPLMEFFGAWPGDKKELERIEKRLKADRKAFKTRNVNL